MGVPFDVSLIVLHLRDSEYGIPAFPSEKKKKNRSASAEFPFVRSLFRDFFARLINSAPLSFNRNIRLWHYAITKKGPCQRACIKCSLRRHAYSIIFLHIYTFSTNNNTQLTCLGPFNAV